MAMSNKPLIWLPFAAGGMLSALLLPSLITLTLLAGLGVLPAEGLSFERIRRFAEHPVGALALLVIIGLILWHAAHRLRMTLQDLGVRAAGSRRILAWACYLAAGGLNLTLIIALARIALV